MTDNEGVDMTDKGTSWASFKAEGAHLKEKLKDLIHEGNVRRVIIEHDGHTIAEFPLTAGVVGAVLAPPLAAIAAVVALFKDCTIKVERTEPAATTRASAGTASSAH
jgi:hypothetical protein